MPNVQQETHGSVLPLAKTPMKSKMLDKMRAKPKARWSIDNVETACSQLGLTWKPPSRGSHYKVSSPFVTERIETIPHDRPIKLFYIKSFIEFADAHIRACEKTEDAHE
jgi:hypothetical protein